MFAGCPESEDSPEVLVERGNLLRDEGRIDEAAVVYREAVKGFLGYVEDDPDDGYAWFELGGLYHWLDDDARSIEAYQKSMQLSAEYAESPFVWYRIGDLHFRAGRADEAIEAYNNALRYDPENAIAFNDRGWCYLTLLKDSESALGDFDEAIRLDPEFVFPIINRAIVHVGANDLELALTDMNRAIELQSDDPTNFVKRADVLRELGRFESAVEDYSMAIDLDDRYPHAYYGRGLARRELGQTEAGDEDIRKAIDLDPGLSVLPVESVTADDDDTSADAAVLVKLGELGYTNLRAVPEDKVFRMHGDRDGHETAIYITKVDADGRARISDADLNAIRDSMLPVDLALISDSESPAAPEVVKVVRDWSPAAVDLRPVQFEFAVPE